MIDTPVPVGELTYTYVYDAPRELVFRCMIEPEHLAQFWGPTGVSTPLATITIDPRPGGVFETVMVNNADGAEYRMRAVFTEVVEAEKLVWFEPDLGMTTTIRFTDSSKGRTLVTMHQSNVPERNRTPEARAGLQTSFDRFAAYLGGF